MIAFHVHGAVLTKAARILHGHPAMGGLAHRPYASEITCLQCSGSLSFGVRISELKLVGVTLFDVYFINLLFLSVNEQVCFCSEFESGRKDRT